MSWLRSARPNGHSYHQGARGSSPSARRSSRFQGIYLGVILALMYVPIILVIVYSFNQSRISSVWEGFSLRWYRELFRDKDLLQSVVNSLILATISSVSAAVIGTLAAVGMPRVKLRSKGVVEYLSTLPIMIPEIILGMVFLVFFALLRLPFGMLTLAIAHTAFCIPYIYMLVKARLVGIDKSYAEAAKDLGATEWNVFFDITFPLILPAIASGMLLSFAMSLDDVVISVFVTGVNTNTMPIRIYTQLKTGVTPKINALCTLMFGATLLIILLSTWIGRRNTHRTARRKTPDMKKALTVTLVLVMFAGLLAGCAKKPSAQLNLFTWEGMFPDEVLEAFTKETGIKINYSNFDFDETMLAKLEAAKGGDYDLVIADDYIIETAIAEGLVQKLDKSKIPNFKNINPIYQGQFYDPNDEYTVPYGAGVQTIVYDPEAVDIEITGYADLWHPSLKNSVGTIANYRVINGMALKVLGESYNTEDIAKINAAGAKLIELAPNIRVIKDDNLQDDLLSGEISAAVMYTSMVTLAKLAKPELKVVYPTEGIGFGVMANFIPSKAPNPDAAHKFIDFILRPEISAQCFEWLGYYCTNKEADALIADEMKDFLTLPEGFSGEGTEMIENISAAAEEAHNKVWTEFKAACGQ
jgi:spermidine/putrescine transport system substrate-binding protein